ncbi:hypothetical protein [Rhodopirellula bahusiensis]|uniref:Uncharacterized protein n=1 Tax=Rhodopirellula bahusiensis TaxID=2014065 RepID=A0A2G1W6D4_9BACT|nr:hypothetical protein [Rhodopirellula bahusiensis]PHQ34592.1 hypothetical protein CEE69_14350 [Rhodopirellula bahusiensis]
MNYLHRQMQKRAVDIIAPHLARAYGVSVDHVRQCPDAIGRPGKQGLVFEVFRGGRWQKHEKPQGDVSRDL